VDLQPEAPPPRNKSLLGVLIFSPLWGILFYCSALCPVITRTSQWLPLVLKNIAGFIGVSIAYLSAQSGLLLLET